MAKRKQAIKQEPDAVYFLKILLFFIIGALWLRFSSREILPGVSSLPIGLVLGIVFAHYEHFQIDRKVEYVVLLVAAVLSYAAPIGIVIEI
ncbi:hypothetical protein HY441_01180 [Candidatus Microgenomates bacterium]|nr:hypothetical protein [Candidatus Microgenomates bacterium]